MYLTLNHQKLDIYKYSKSFALACYRLTKKFPADEKFAMVSQIRRAALSVHLNIAEGASRKSEGERKRFYEISRSSVIEIDAALDIAHPLGYLESIGTSELEYYMIKCFKILTGMINYNQTG